MLVQAEAKYNEMLKSTLTPYAPLPQPRAEKYESCLHGPDDSDLQEGPSLRKPRHSEDYSRVDIGMAPSTSTVSKRASHPQEVVY